MNHSTDKYSQETASPSKAMQLHNGTGVGRIIRAAQCSLRGLVSTLKHESAFRQEVALACIFIPFAIWLGETLISKLFLIGTIVIVLIVELLNSAVEAAIDRIGTDYHELSGRAKDTGSAAVLMSLIFTTTCFTAVAVDRFIF